MDQVSADVVAQAEAAVARWHARRAAEAKRERATAPTAASPRQRQRSAPAPRHRGAGRRHTEESRRNVGRSNLQTWASRVDLDAVPPLTRARLARELSTRAAARLCGVSPITFRRVEAGHTVGEEYRRKVLEQFPEVSE